MLEIILLILVIVIIAYLVWLYLRLRKLYAWLRDEEVTKRANELLDAVVNLERVTFDGAANNSTKRIAPGPGDPGHLPPPPPGFE